MRYLFDIFHMQKLLKSKDFEDSNVVTSSQIRIEWSIFSVLECVVSWFNIRTGIK